MIRHRPVSSIPRLTGANNYKEWSQKVELHMRIHGLWEAVMAPPKPIKIKTDREKFIYVASRKRIYIQCPQSMTLNAKLLLLMLVEPTLLTFEHHEMSVPVLWRTLKRAYGRTRSVKSKRNAPSSTGEKARNC